MNEKHMMTVAIGEMQSLWTLAEIGHLECINRDLAYPTELRTYHKKLLDTLKQRIATLALAAMNGGGFDATYNPRKIKPGLKKKGGA